MGQGVLLSLVGTGDSVVVALIVEQRIWKLSSRETGLTRTDTTNNHRWEQNGGIQNRYQAE